jgi:hypothetical protein
MESKVNEIEINGVKYVPKDMIQQEATKLDGLKYVIVRAETAGVFAGYLEKKEADEVTLRNVRRLWYWSGANSCSALALDGVSKPEACKFTAPNSKILIRKWIEILDCTKKAQTILEGVKIWVP